MKSQTNRYSDYDEEYNDLLDVMDLAQFLIKLKVPAAEQLYSEASDRHSDTFCSDCERFRDECSCENDHRDYDMYDDGADYED